MIRLVPPTPEELDRITTLAYETHTKWWAGVWKHKYGIEPLPQPPWEKLSEKDRLPWQMMIATVGPHFFNIAVKRYEEAQTKQRDAMMRIVKREIARGVNPYEALQTAYETLQEAAAIAEREEREDKAERRRGA